MFGSFDVSLNHDVFYCASVGPRTLALMQGLP
jgi:hypothetical protein